ncbi:multicopper oxidase family protein [Streptomyces sp. NBC_01500]|uniref:multicopper oxidase family protein n=1 Tax=Streptomyces sp. NBC_01500 TaxID=2903886 RepID=UPI002251C689|nr:multicopper oxidase family protein [Streptomyces sp. NBC_01500]MCX4551489.1 multicopper oxidase family protein [Streptomyces sp. NBC_01500]
MRIHHPSRRSVLGASLAVAGTGLLAACSSSPDGHHHSGSDSGSAAGRKIRLTAARASLDLGGGRTVSSWAYGDRLPGKEIRATAGETLAVTVANHLPQSTSLHWHGIALPNAMDGVPGLTQRAVKPGADFTYRFAVPDPGTYWFHPHSGVQQDRGLYAPLIVDDPREPLAYDKEWVVILDDWVDGVGGSTPDAVLAELRGGMGPSPEKDGPDHSSGSGSGHDGHDMGDMGGMDGMDGMEGMGGRAGTATGASPGPSPSASHRTPSRMLMGATSPLLGGDAGDVAYPYYLVNGRTAQDPSVFTAEPGDRIRLRIINAGGDTAFRIALGGHRLTVTHTDGYPVRHTTTDALLLGMGERYDVLVTAGDGAFPLTALAEGKGAAALAVLRTSGGAAPTASVRPKELSGKLVTADRLEAAESVALAHRTPDRTVRLRLTGGMAAYDWGFDGKPYAPDRRHPVRKGERVRLVFSNPTGMWHPLHLHGHTFALTTRPGGARKDTAIVLPKGTLSVDFDADNPGLWMIHCHNVYHAEAGMMTVLGYQD